MNKDSEYNKAHNALSTLQTLGKIEGKLVTPLPDSEYHDLSGKIAMVRTSQELVSVVEGIQKSIKVNKHTSRAKMLKFALSKGYRPLKGDDKSDDPLQQYTYQLPSGYYRTIYLVKIGV